MWMTDQTGVLAVDPPKGSVTTPMARLAAERQTFNNPDSRVTEWSWKAKEALNLSTYAD